MCRRGFVCTLEGTRLFEVQFERTVERVAARNISCC